MRSRRFKSSNVFLSNTPTVAETMSASANDTTLIHDIIANVKQSSNLEGYEKSATRGPGEEANDRLYSRDARSVPARKGYDAMRCGL